MNFFFFFSEKIPRKKLKIKKYFQRKKLYKKHKKFGKKKNSKNILY